MKNQAHSFISLSLTVQRPKRLTVSSRKNGPFWMRFPDAGSDYFLSWRVLITSPLTTYL